MKFGDVSKFASPFCVAKFSSIYSLRSSLFIKEGETTKASSTHVLMLHGGYYTSNKLHRNFEFS
jgi:hypothetical protein